MVPTNTPPYKSEEIIFFIDLSTDFLKRKTLIKALESFVKEKEKVSGNSKYGLVFFKEGKDIFSIYQKDPEFIIDLIDDSWDERDINNSYFENGLYEILARVFKKSRTINKTYRIVVLSDTVSSLSEEYHTALYNLVIKAKNFSTFIDIIRIGEKKFYEDDVRLKIITSETYGGTLYCKNAKQLDTYLNSLVKSKDDYNIIQPKPPQILQEDITFYEKLAADLISLSENDKKVGILCEQELCPICEAYSDVLYKCYNCNASFHSCCIAEYSITNNIGFSHIFRCPQCSALLKIDKDFVDMVEADQKGEDYQIFSGEEDLEIEAETREEYQEAIVERQEVHTPTQKKVKIGGFFGSEVTINASSNSKGNISINSSNKKETDKISISKLKPPKKRKKITLCSICGTSVKNSSICPVCGSKV
ncbi:MAG: hypothetical protein GF317_00035 [Candidatus Lokiarchaeota archaeon]|nr:hypothetical protein [Candidatus Lokiarchaeota archaeon]MBD3198375.1 hypothetical protein [Candidatus Lokiarchaeota archaeon]